MSNNSDNTASSSSSTTPVPYNLVRLCGTSRGSCGYCCGKRAHLLQEKGNGPRTPEDSSKAYGLLFSSLSPRDYESLLYRGWRRSGLHVYKPDNFDSCCPALTIRLPVNEFRMTKSQRKVWTRMQKALKKDQSSGNHSVKTEKKHIQERGAPKERTTGKDGPSQPNRQDRSESSITAVDATMLEKLCKRTRDIVQERIHVSDSKSLLQHEIPTIRFKVHKKSKFEWHTITLATTICAALSGRSRGALDRGRLCQDLASKLYQVFVTDEVDHSAPVRKVNGQVATPLKSRVLNVEAHVPSGQVLVTVQHSLPQQKLHQGPERPTCARAVHVGHIDGRMNKIERWLQSRRRLQVAPQQGNGDTHYSFHVTTVPAHQSALQPDVHQLYFLYQHRVHGDPDILALMPSNLNGIRDCHDRTGMANQSKANATVLDSEVDWGSASRDWIARAKSMLTEQYGSQAPVAEFVSFYKFLVESPLGREDRMVINELSLLPGTYHQQYRVDGQLIAVGVVDILPCGLSSVYAFYDPGFANHICPLGKYTSLHEIHVAQKLGLPYYYMGYFIESCPKMVYKADYQPSQLLCPTHYVWVDAVEGRNTLRSYSPKMHCCTLSRITQMDSVADETGVTVERGELSDILLDVGGNALTNFSMLNERGQELVRPLLEEFLEYVGRDVGPRCIIQLV